MITVNYPGKKRLTEAEAAEVLRTGSPEPKWFEPFAVQGVWLGRETKHGYGYVHVYSIDGSFQFDFATWNTKEGLGAGLEALWRHHTRQGLQQDPTYPRCEDCQGVVYFVPDELPRLRLVIEYDEDDDPDDDAGDEEADS